MNRSLLETQNEKENGTLGNANLLWAKEEAFDKVKAGTKSSEMEPTPVVITMFSQGAFEARFLPDGRVFM